MSNPSLKKLGKNIKFARRAIGLSQEKFAERLGKCRNYVGMIERAEINMPVSVLFDIAKICKISPKELFEFK